MRGPAIYRTVVRGRVIMSFLFGPHGHWPLGYDLRILFLVLFGISTAYAQDGKRSGNSYLACQQHAEKEAERLGSVAGGAVQGALNGAVIGVFLGGSKAAEQGAMLGLVAGGYKRSQETKQFYDKAYAECRGGRIDIR